MESFVEALAHRVLLFDGAMGTQIQDREPEPKDFPDNRDGFNDGLILTHPEWIGDIHRSYLDAGADCIETNSFGSNTIKLNEYGFGDRTVQFNKTAASLAREVCDEYTDRRRYVVGTMGPTGYLPSTNDPDLGQVPLDQISDAFRLQAEGLISGGADALLIETSQDILEVKLAIEGAERGMRNMARTIPLIANITLAQTSTMLLGTPVQAAYATVSGMGINVFGINCSTGPQEMEPAVRWLNEEGRHPVLVVPNAGIPENDGGKADYKMGPGEMASALDGFLSKYGNVRIVGGCCGTGPGHIRALRRVVDSRAPGTLHLQEV
jgi:5-methyltetrahydrofolate--homocysteine methyltransferase